jgi:hypothetical protein
MRHGSASGRECEDMMIDDVTSAETERVTAIRELIVALDRRKAEPFREPDGALVVAVLARVFAQADRTIPRQVSPSDRTIPRLAAPPDRTIHRASTESADDEEKIVKSFGCGSFII